MAVTQFSSSNDLTVKLWSERTAYDFDSDLELPGMMMKAGIIKRLDDTSRKSGDRIRMAYLQRLTGKGLLGNAAATGNEDQLTYFDDDLLINQIRYAIDIPAPQTIDLQRVLLNLSEDSYRVLSEWQKQRAAVAIFNQLCGNTATTITYDGQTYAGSDRLLITGLNTARAPSTTSGVTRIIRPNGLTTDQAVAADTTATMKLSFILSCETIAETSRPYIRPLTESGMGEAKYHMYVHSEQWNQLMNDTSSPYQYRDLQNALITSGRGEGQIPNSFMFSNTMVMKSDKLPLGVDSGTSAAVSNCRRAVFCGAEAAGMAFGQGFGSAEGKGGWVVKSDMYDIGQVQRIAMSGIYGISKVQFNGVDNSSIVISTYSTI